MAVPASKDELLHAVVDGYDKLYMSIYSKRARRSKAIVSARTDAELFDRLRQESA